MVKYILHLFTVFKILPIHLIVTCQQHGNAFYSMNTWYKRKEKTNRTGWLIRGTEGNWEELQSKVIIVFKVLGFKLRPKNLFLLLSRLPVSCEDDGYDSCCVSHQELKNNRWLMWDLHLEFIYFAPFRFGFPVNSLLSKKHLPEPSSVVYNIVF